MRSPFPELVNALIGLTGGALIVTAGIGVIGWVLTKLFGWFMSVFF